MRRASASAEALVRGPVVVTPQLPAQVSPGDRFEAAVAVANNGDGPLHATLSVKTDDALRLLDAPPSEVTVAAGEETVLPFRVEVADRPGGAEISFTVSADGVNVMRAGSLSVRPASALRASAKVGVAASSTTLSTGRTLYPYGAEGSARFPRCLCLRCGALCAISTPIPTPAWSSASAGPCRTRFF